MFTLSAPGKLMLSGEWSVLEKGVPCIVIAVNKRVYVSIKEAEQTVVKLRDFGITAGSRFEGSEIVFDRDDEKLLFTKFAVNVALQYLRQMNIQFKNFELETRADESVVKNFETGKEVKVGFGTSAAAVVAIIAAVLKLHNVIALPDDVKISLKEKELLFKLAIIAHYLGQGKLGSGFDVAASTFGGALVYKRFDPQWLEKALQEKTIIQVIEEKWPLLEHRNTDLPASLELLVAFTGTSASTRLLVQRMREFKKDRPEEYQWIIQSIKNVTEQLITALKDKNREEILALLDKNRELLEDLSEACSCHLEIEAHWIMSDIAAKHGGVAKFSGAGGGDCSVGVCFDKDKARKILEEWTERKFTPIDVTVTKEGVRIEGEK
ncbi:MAG: phosphomevalonate kinase [Candidatus Odinarchaeota archaeon]